MEERIKKLQILLRKERKKNAALIRRISILEEQLKEARKNKA